MTRNVFPPGFPTPSVTEAATLCRTVKLPNDTMWLAVLMGALALLENPDNWNEVGDLTRDEAAAAFQDIIWDMYNNNECLMLPAPFWDESTGDDADDELPVDDQIWYGELVPVEEMAAHAFLMEDDPPPDPELTWRENASIWIVTAFVAYAATPFAAIAFYPIAKRFVLEFRTHPLGAFVNAVWNGTEITRLDTYSPTDSVASVSVIIPDDTGGMGSMDSPPVLWVSMLDEVNPAVTGEPNIQVIRKRLTPTEVTPATLRYNEDCNCVQSTFDDGATWVDNPGADPRRADAYKQPVSGEDVRCEAAGGMVQLVKNTLNDIQAAGNVLGAANAVLAIITVLTGGAGIIVDLILAVIDALFAIGLLAIQDNFDDAAYGRILCYFYCSINNEGSVDDAAMARLEVQIAAEFTINVVVYDVMEVLINLWGQVMLQNAGIKFADSEADCSGCECVSCDITLTIEGGTWLDLPQGIVTSATTQSNGYVHSGDGQSGIITFEHAVWVCSWSFTNNGSNADGWTARVGTQSLSVGGTFAWTLDNPELTDSVQIEVVGSGGGAWGHFVIVYSEP